MESRIFPRLPPEIYSRVLRFVDLLGLVPLLRVSTIACRESLRLLLPRLMYLEPGDVKDMFGITTMYAMPLFQPMSEYFLRRMKYHSSLNLSRYTYPNPASHCVVVITYGKRRESFVCRLDAIPAEGSLRRCSMSLSEENLEVVIGAISLSPSCNVFVSCPFEVNGGGGELRLEEIEKLASPGYKAQASLSLSIGRSEMIRVRRDIVRLDIHGWVGLLLENCLEVQ